jgi:hypothetical protein
MLTTMLMGALLAGSGPDRAGHCTAIPGDRERLACYDAAYRTAAPPPAVSQAPPAAAAPASAAPQEPGGDFGLSGVQRERQRGEPSRIDEMRGVVTEVEPSRTGRSAFRLSNGQRWIQSEATDRPAFRAGDAILIRRASMNSYLAVVPDSGRAAIRVRRLE